MGEANKTTKAKIGWYNLPADFQCFDVHYLISLKDMTFEERVSDLYLRFTGKNLPPTAFDKIANSDFPASILSVDEGISCLELNDGLNANYKDYFFDDGSTVSEVISLAITVVSAYVDLCDGDMLEFGEKINVAVALSDGRWLLALYLLKYAKLPIDTAILGTKKPVDDIVKGFSFQTVMPGECEEIIKAFFEETDYVLDPISACGLVAYDVFYSDYEDDNLTLLISLVSPYFFARNVVKSILNANEISVDRAIKHLYTVSALEIPQGIADKTLLPFYSTESDFSVKDALEIIK